MLALPPGPLSTAKEVMTIRPVNTMGQFRPELVGELSERFPQRVIPLIDRTL